MTKDLFVTIMLPWFDEPEELLYQCVASCAVIGDKVIAADGAYDFVPDKRPVSAVSQRDTIERAARDAGLAVDFLPARLWDGQVQKRNALLRAATQDLGERTGRIDYVLPVDADWVLSGDRDAIRAELARGYVEEFKVQFHQPNNPTRNAREIAPHSWHLKQNGLTWWYAILFRALYEMKLEKTHWHYSGKRRNGKRVGLSGGAQLYPPAISKNLRAEFLIEHRCMFRDTKQLERNRVYSARRDRERELVGYEV